MFDAVRSAGGVAPAFRPADFTTITEALDYAARGRAGLSFYSGRGLLVEHLSYERLREDAVRLARRMLGSGLRRADRVAMIADTDANFVRSFFACQYAGLIPVPLPLPASFGGREAYIEQLRAQIRVCGAAAAVGPADFAGFLQAAGEGIASGLVGGFDLFENGADWSGQLQAPDPTQLCYLQFSSGSTRQPAGVAVTHRALMSNAAGIVRAGVKVVPGDRCVSWLPFYHDMGLVGCLLAPVAAQVPVDYLATRDFARRPLLWLSLLSQNGGTLSYSPSFGYELCARRAESTVPEGLDLRAWRVAGIGGDMIRPQVLRRFGESFAASGFSPSAFVPSYGLAEATLAVSFGPLGRGIETDRVGADEVGEGDAVVFMPCEADTRRSRELVRCGHKLPDIEIEIRTEAGAVLPDGVVGRVVVRGPGVMEGYFNDPVQTRRALTSDGWLDTGDLGYLRLGALVIAGRAKDLIIINGRNVWPQDLEWAAERVPEVRPGDVAAFAVENDEAGTERAVLVVECRTNDPELRSSLAKAVGAAVREATAVDCEVVLVPPRTLPHTSSGKLSRVRAKQDFLQGKFDAIPARQLVAGAAR
jgi:fatty-acyl-CoA synthase